MRGADALADWANMNQSAALRNQLNAALELHRQGRLAEAAQAYQAVLVNAPDQVDALHLFGVLLTQSGRADEAVPLLARAVELTPANPEFNANLARAHHALGSFDAAIPSMRAASELAPESADYLCALGALVQETQDSAGAQGYYEAALRRDPRHITSRYNLATLSHELADTSRGVEILEPLVGEHPNNSSFRTTLGGYLLELDRVEDGLAHCQAALAANPWDLMAMTLISVAYLRLGRRADAQRLLDLDRFVVSGSIDVPSGYDDLHAFNSALEAHVTTHPTLVHERASNATRNGHHTENLLLDEDKGPMARLEAIFNAAVGQYLRALPHEAGHPFLARRPPNWRLQAWAVVMHSQGHQLAHTHPSGWVSGVYYARTPISIRADDSSQAGWIEFGRPLPELIKDAPPITQRLRPQEGLLVLFPSYLYHETIPFNAHSQDDGNRISIAFDAVPS